VKKKLKAERNQILEEIARLRKEFWFYAVVGVGAVVGAVICLFLLIGLAVND
jgi:hypothetical protein